MKKMKIEKQLIFADVVKQVVNLDVQEGLTYKHDEDGIRALGPLFIKGQYEGNDGVENFQETLEMDVLAPTDKLNGDDFKLEVADFQGISSEEGIQVFISLNIHGIKEGNESNPSNERVVVADHQSEEQPLPPVQSRHSVFPEYPQPVVEVKPTVVEEEKVEAPVSETKSAVDDFNDLFSSAESTYTSYRIIVAKVNDTYTGIANRYDVDEIALRDTNKNKEILAKTLVILPFQQK